MRASKTVVAIKKIISHGDAAVSRTMFEDARADGDISSDDVQRLFDAAAEKGAPAVCEIFLDAGADINALDRLGRTALQRAIDNRSVTFTRYLLKRGALPDVRNERGQTALHLVHMCAGIVRNPKEVTLCSLLLEKGGDPNVVCKDYRTPLHNAVFDQNPDTARLLVAAGADPSFVPEEPPFGYLTPFQTALDLGNPIMARFFLRECTVDVYEKTLDDRTLAQLTRNVLIRQDLRAAQTASEVEKGLGSHALFDVVPARSPCGPML